MQLSRRELLAVGSAAAMAAAPGTGLPGSGSQSAYRHRGYLGWITDLDPRPDPQAVWPSYRLDAPLLAEYKKTFSLMKALGYNNLVIWGLYVTRYWPANLSAAVSPERGKLVSDLIDSAHRQGLRVVSGLGVFSWGFEELIRINPSLSRTNPKAMCASNPEAWKWMEKITDFVFTRFPIDGVSMQSADLGRCNCKDCSRYSDAEYHSRINIREADYIRTRWPNKIVAVSGWGMKFEDPASLPYMLQMGEKLDYLIDVVDSTRQRGEEYRRKVIRELRCDFGTIGGPLVEPPQHWARDRWFLPTAKAQGEHLELLASDGGRACEYFFHIRANPGDEVSFWVAGKLMADIQTPWPEHLRATVEELYQVARSGIADDLTGLFVEAEDAYMKRIKPILSGDISLEPLVESFAGPPVYLSQRLTPQGRTEYGAALRRIADSFRRIASEVGDKTRIPLILRCIQNVQNDLIQISA